MPDTVTIQLGNEEIEIERIENRPGGGAVLDVQHEDGRTWRVIVTATGELKDVELTWRDDDLVDLSTPDWLDDILARLAAPA